MSSKIFVLCLGLAVLGAVGCTGIFVPKEQYDRDVNQQKEYITALERDNSDLKAKADAYDQLKDNQQLDNETAKAYAEMAESLKKALAGMGVDEKAVYVDRTTGAHVFGTDLLFDSGKFEISVKGREVLKKFAEANSHARLKIVGHTDPVRIAKKETQDHLYTDSNPELSALRAAVVLAELKKDGIPEKNMWLEGRGSTQPRGSNKDSRRVEIFIEGATTGAVKTSLKK